MDWLLKIWGWLFGQPKDKKSSNSERNRGGWDYN